MNSKSTEWSDHYFKKGNNLTMFPGIGRILPYEVI